MSYQHLTLDQRYQMAAMLRVGLSKRQVAAEIGCHPSTVGRELRRNHHGRCYIGAIAHGHAKRRRRAASSRPHIPEHLIRELLTRLEEKHSPEQVFGRLALLRAGGVSRTTVYRYARKMGLRVHLRLPKRRRRYGRGAQPLRFADRRSIHDRPSIVDTRERVGDWELDTVHPSRLGGVLVTMLERRTGLACVAWSPDATAKAVTASILSKLKRFKAKVHTLTCDRGSEFAANQMLEAKLEAEVYFADPSSPWQRGCNENFNGLLRQYFPRGRDFRTITKRELLKVETSLNNRPRKRLGYFTPFEKFFDILPVALQG